MANESEEFGRLTHEMSNALAYVVTNLNLLQEALEEQHAAQTAEPKRLEVLVEDAMEGSERLGALLRSLRRLSWGEGGTPIPVMREEAPVRVHRILVIDDETAILAAVERALRPHRVDVVNNGKEAIERLLGDEEPYDLVLCDLIMNGVSGIDVFQTLQEQAPEQAERVVFMTGGGFTADIRHFLAEVDNSILHKPFDVKTLRWMVSQRLQDHG